MRCEEFERLWMEVFEVRVPLAIATQHAFEGGLLTDDDRANLAYIDTMSEAAAALLGPDLDQSERLGVMELQRQISVCRERADTYRQVAWELDGSPQP